MRYRAFISYSHADARQAAWLHRRLEGYRLPSRLRGGRGEHGPLPERLSPIFRDRDDLSSAGQLGPQIEAALAESEALVVLCSPNAARSAFVDSEILAYKRLGRGDRIYAFIVDGEPNAGDARECFPAALRYELAADGSIGHTPANPIAADARPGKDGKSLALLKVIAGLFGLPLDTLRQREAHRRHMRMAAITGLAVLVMLVTSVLAVQAVIARNAAERRQKQAEALVEFMLGDLNDKLSEVGRLDILASVNDKAMEYFTSLPDTDITPEAIEQRAKALVKIGEVRSEQGEFAKAMQSFRAAAELTGRLATQARSDVPRQLSHADVLAYVGLTHWYQGDLANAEKSFHAAHDVLAAARKLAPADEQLLFQLSTVDNNVGHVLEAKGDIEAATVHYQRMLDAAGHLAKLDPDDAEWQTQLAVAHNNLAKMALLRGDLPAAVTGYAQDTAIRARMVQLAPADNGQRRLLLVAHATLGRTLALAGDPDQGARLLRKAVDEARRLHAMEPDSTTYQGDLGRYAMQLARVERQRGGAKEADALIGESLRIMETLVRENPDQPEWRRQRAEALTERAAQLIDRGVAPPEATALLGVALAELEPLLADAPQERGTVLATVEARLRLAPLSPEPARTALAKRSLDTIAAQASARNDPRLRALHAQALQQSGRLAESRTVAKALLASGYRAPVFDARRAAGAVIRQTAAERP